AEHRDDIRKQSGALTQVFAESLPPPPGEIEFDAEPLRQARTQLTQQFDSEFGGFGGAPKFPHPTLIEFLLRTWRASAHDEQPDLQSLYMATLTLTRMADGGLYDQLGGGFCRYSVDRHWMIPHFEKMLYDNGALLAIYSQAAIATGDALYARIARETAAWIMRDMQSTAGGFWSALDADSEGHEGKFYVWTPDKARALLTDREFAVFASRFGLDSGPNFEDAWHLHVYKSLDEVSQAIGISAVDAEQLLNSARAKLLVTRNTRIWPHRDEKILTSWNALAIKGMSLAARALEDDELSAAAMRAVDFIRTTLWSNGRLLAVYKDGQAKLPAYLDDHAFLLDALIELLQTRWRTSDLSFAIEIADTLLN
ncbi:MAG: thioredoxin domain-containing protein, partial [Chthoniobacterales bacterium]